MKTALIVGLLKKLLPPLLGAAGAFVAMSTPAYHAAFCVVGYAS